MEERKNAMTGWVLFLIPAFFLFLLSSLIAPLKLAFRDIVWVPYVCYTGALVLGWYLRQRSGVKKDHEWQRSKAVKNLQKHYDKEEKGLWLKETEVSSDLSLEARAALQGSVGKLLKERTTEEISSDSKTDADNVNLLIEEDHVSKATRRVSGDESFDDEAVVSTIGAVRKRSLMDRFLDWTILRFKDRDAAKDRERSKRATLEARAQESPVENTNLSAIHQRNEVQRLEESQVQQPGLSSQPTNETPKPQHQVIPQAASPEPAVVSPSGQSIEEMAGLVSPSATRGSQISSSSQPSSFATARCSACGQGNNPGQRFCENCGNEL